MNLGASTSKINVNQQDNKQYIPSRIFTQDNRTNEEKNLSSPQHHISGTTPINHLQSPTSGGFIQTPGTPYSSYYPRSVGPYYSSTPSTTSNLSSTSLTATSLSSTPPRRFGITSSSSNISHHQSGNSNQQSHHHHHQQLHHHHHHPPSDLAQIPLTSIYDEPKQQKQQILQQHQQQQYYQQFQKSLSIQQQQVNQNQLYQQVNQQITQQQQQQQQQLLQPQDLNTTINYHPTQQQQQQQQQQQSPLNNTTLYNNNYSSNLLSQSTAGTNLNNSTLGLSTIGGQPQQQTNIFIQSVPTPLNQMFSEKYDKRWLTIFGFPQDKTDLIVDEISKYGKILEREFPYQSNCNWVYLKFDSEAAASDVLKKNGLIIGNFMIGIVPYKDKLINESDPIKAPKENSYLNMERNYVPARSDYDPQSFSNASVLTTPSRPSFLTKVSEYVFGSG